MESVFLYSRGTILEDCVEDQIPHTWHKEKHLLYLQISITECCTPFFNWAHFTICVLIWYSQLIHCKIQCLLTYCPERSYKVQHFFLPLTCKCILMSLKVFKPNHCKTWSVCTFHNIPFFSHSAAIVLYITSFVTDQYHGERNHWMRMSHPTTKGPTQPACTASAPTVSLGLGLLVIQLNFHGPCGDLFVISTERHTSCQKWDCGFPIAGQHMGKEPPWEWTKDIPTD